MAVMRTAVAVIVAMTCAEAALQQPPRDGRPLQQTPSALLTQAHEHYKAQQWERAVQKYENALAASPEQFGAWFFLANSYDNLYQPSRAGEPLNDSYIQKAVGHYRSAAQRERDPGLRKRALQFLMAAFGPDKLNDPAQAEPVAVQLIELDPADTMNYLVVSKLYEDGGRYDEAERWLLEAKGREPTNQTIYTALSAFYNRQGDFTRTMEALLQAADLEPHNPEGHQRVAVFYWEKAFRDHRLTPAQKHEYLVAGIAATDRALAINPDHVDALTYKNILLRMQANEESDRLVQQALLAEADGLRNRAIELSRQRAPRGGARGSATDGVRFVTPPPPPPPPSPPGEHAGGMPPVRVGGDIPPPTKIKHADPVYPAEALNANVQGVVILETTIDIHGQVSDARVLRSIPMLDQAAIDAVRQWAFTPTYLNGMAVPVIMTVTVNFTRR